MKSGERQVSPTLAGIRADHTARYNWAATTLPPGSHVLDLACGVGYGAYILAQAGHTVVAVDRDQEAIDYANAHWRHARIKFMCCDAENDAYMGETFDAVTCFETIEHIKDPLPVLRRFACGIPLLLASVPNEEVFPWSSLGNGKKVTIAFHHRHYTRQEFADLLAASGFEAVEWLGQEGPRSEVARDINGRTLVVVAKRSGATKTEKRQPKLIPATAVEKVKAPPTKRAVPNSIAIVALGPSLNTYIGIVKSLGSTKRLCDEVWGVNALGDVLKCDLLFAMDDPRIQEIRAAAHPQSNIAAMLPWLRAYHGPGFTSRAHPDYPGLAEFPLADVLNSCGGNRYFNSTPAYAIAYAIHIGVKKIFCFGMDYTLQSAHDAEKGRACAEFWLGFASARGIELSFPKTTTLHDACVPPAERLYGYDTVNVEITGESGTEQVRLVPRDVLPTAEEIEARYDHSAHPNQLVAQ